MKSNHSDDLARSFCTKAECAEVDRFADSAASSSTKDVVFETARLASLHERIVDVVAVTSLLPPGDMKQKLMREALRQEYIVRNRRYVYCMEVSRRIPSTKSA